MKHTLVLATLLAVATLASGQTALYKKYAQHPDLRVYCVERYPLTSRDTVTLTFIEAESDSVAAAVRDKLMDLIPKRTHTAADDQPTIVADTPALADKAKALEDEWRKHKHVISFLSDPLPGDSGRYMVACPSDRPVILVFHIYNERQHRAVTQHIVHTELK